MTSLRKFNCNDLLKYNNINLDPLTETYGIPFYLQYLSKWPYYISMAVDNSNRRMGYVMGKAEGNNKNWHGHVTAVTVSPEYRRLGLARQLMNELERVSEKLNAYFVDLFVRKSNDVAIDMYKKLGYCVYREVINYYSGERSENAYDMRIPMPRDVDKESIKPLKNNMIHPHELDFD